MFRFTIRELILLTVIVAMGAAWWVDRKDSAAKFNQLVALGEQAKKMHAAEMAIEKHRHKIELETQQSIANLRAKGVPVYMPAEPSP